MKVGFVGLGNVGGRLAASVLRAGFELTVHDLDDARARPLLTAGAVWADRPCDVAAVSDVVVTCLPSPAAISAVMDATDGILAGLRPGTVWVEMSTADAAQVLDLAERVTGLDGFAADCPVSGGCHRASTGNIAILAGCERVVLGEASTTAHSPAWTSPRPTRPSGSRRATRSSTRPEPGREVIVARARPPD